MILSAENVNALADAEAPANVYDLRDHVKRLVVRVAELESLLPYLDGAGCGEHSYANCRCACHGCNCKKSATLPSGVDIGQEKACG